MRPLRGGETAENLIRTDLDVDSMAASTTTVHYFCTCPLLLWQGNLSVHFQDTCVERKVREGSGRLHQVRWGSGWCCGSTIDANQFHKSGPTRNKPMPYPAVWSLPGLHPEAPRGGLHPSVSGDVKQLPLHCSCVDIISAGNVLCNAHTR